MLIVAGGVFYRHRTPTQASFVIKKVNDVLKDFVSLVKGPGVK